MPVYFIQSTQVSGQQIQITGELAHHLGKVLRLKTGEALVVDENRRRYQVALNKVSADEILAQILSIQDSENGSPFKIILAQALLKNPKMDWVIQKATELGMSELVPVVTEHTVVRPSKDRSAHQQKRWSKIAKEASQQSNRVELPKVSSMVSFTDLCNQFFPVDLKLIFWEGEPEAPIHTHLQSYPKIRSVLMVVGPEGGFSPHELNQALKAGFKPTSLGKRTLRAETASLAALTVLQYELGDMR